MPRNNWTLQITSVGQVANLRPIANQLSDGIFEPAFSHLNRGILRWNASSYPKSLSNAARVRFTISPRSDNGIGVPQEYLERIFVPFQRLHSRDEFAGNGLGLATCRRIAAAWGGEVIAEAGSDGGLVIRVTVPGTQSI